MAFWDQHRLSLRILTSHLLWLELEVLASFKSRKTNLQQNFDRKSLRMITLLQLQQKTLNQTRRKMVKCIFSKTSSWKLNFTLDSPNSNKIISKLKVIQQIQKTSMKHNKILPKKEILSLNFRLKRKWMLTISPRYTRASTECQHQKVIRLMSKTTSLSWLNTSKAAMSHQVMGISKLETKSFNKKSPTTQELSQVNKPWWRRSRNQMEPQPS